MRASCWCFALCQNIGMQCMLFWRYLNANCAIVENALFLKFAASLNLHEQSGTNADDVYDLQPTLSELKKTFIKTRRRLAEKF